MAPKRAHPRPRRGRDDGGYVAAVMALLLTVLLTFSAFAVDVGGWYARASQLQRAADAGALAGVVWMPDLTTATTTAVSTIRQNGISCPTTTSTGCTGTNITVVVAQPAGNNRQLKVTITDSKVKQYFSQLVLSSPGISRSATAEYVLPVPLGSPDNTLGNQSNTDTRNLWASISGPDTDKANGDPYSTKCAVGSSGSGCTGNIPPGSGREYRNTGYLYAIDVPAADVGKSLTVQVWDAGNYARPNYANTEDADNGTVNTEFELFSPTTTPLDSSSYTSSTYSLNGKCTSGAGRWIIPDGTSSATYKNLWATLCTVVVGSAGIYHLQVKSSAIPGVTDGGNGWNQYSLRATVPTAPQPSLYGYGDLSLFNNLPGQSGNLSATFYLAQVDPVHAGKHMKISLFDPGDGASGSYNVNILQAGGATIGCTYGARGGSTTTTSTCQITTRTSTGSNVYNGLWLDIDIAIPTTYTCSTDCWWKVKYNFNNVVSGSSPNDRTVWAAEIIGDPVHLVAGG